MPMYRGCFKDLPLDNIQYFTAGNLLANLFIGTRKPSHLEDYLRGRTLDVSRL